MIQTSLSLNVGKGITLEYYLQTVGHTVIYCHIAMPHVYRYIHILIKQLPTPTLLKLGKVL